MKRVWQSAGEARRLPCSRANNAAVKIVGELHYYCMSLMREVRHSKKARFVLHSSGSCNIFQMPTYVKDQESMCRGRRASNNSAPISGWCARHDARCKWLAYMHSGSTLIFLRHPCHILRFCVHSLWTASLRFASSLAMRLQRQYMDSEAPNPICYSFWEHESWAHR
jgi:hypothetical protein